MYGTDLSGTAECSVLPHSAGVLEIGVVSPFAKNEFLSPSFKTLGEKNIGSIYQYSGYILGGQGYR